MGVVALSGRQVRYALLGCALVLMTSCGTAPSPHATTPLAPPRVHGVVAGRAHACARHADGTVSCWGDGGEGQLGDGERLVRTTPVFVFGLADVEELAAGSRHTCARDHAGRIFCWGARHRGEVGDASPDATPALAPVRVSGIDDATQITAGDAHSCAVRRDGTVWCWGDDLHGQLGRGGAGGPDAYASSPVRVEGVVDAVEVRAGGAHSCARMRSGTVACWGDGSAGQLGETGASQAIVSHAVLVTGLVDATELTLGDRHSCARHGEGLVACWGDGSGGQLGDGSLVSRATPADVVGLEDLERVEEIDAGREHTCARLASSEVRCWGRNDRGQLGDGTFVDRSAPARATAMATQVAAGGADTCALDDRGEVHCWGDNAFGQLGDGRQVFRAHPELVAGLDHATALRAGGDDTCARIENRWLCWGDDAFGQLGDRATQTRPTPTALLVAPEADDVVLGPSRACVVRAGELACWGRDEGAIAVLEPHTMTAHARNASIASAFACVLGEEGRVACWGTGTRGELGRGTNASDAHADFVIGITDAVALGAGDHHACAVLATGHVRCWGSNEEGQLGVSGRDDRIEPVDVDAITDARTIAVGLAHTCVTHVNGAVSCWGRGRDGELGNGAALRSEVPIQVRGIVDVEDVVAGVAHTCARTRNGEVYCWGANRWGQIGADAGQASMAPVRVEGLSARAIAAGSSHTCALVEGGVACWGADQSGQLGDGASLSSATPVLVRFGAPPAASVGEAAH